MASFYSGGFLPALAISMASNCISFSFELAGSSVNAATGFLTSSAFELIPSLAISSLIPLIMSWGIKNYASAAGLEEPAVLLRIDLSGDFYAALCDPASYDYISTPALGFECWNLGLAWLRFDGLKVCFSND